VSNILKSILRKKFKALRQGILDRETAAKSLADNFFSNIKLKKKYIISSFIPINDEIDVMHLTQKLFDADHTIVIPVANYAEDVLNFKRWEPNSELSFNQKVQCYEVVGNELFIPEILLVPLLAFDRTLMRLGYGGGWYDKTINKISSKNPLLIGIGYDLQLSEEILPFDVNDQKMDIIITELNIYHK
jgi:5-formyltetrahydrofolate cyclo-ligase